MAILNCIKREVSNSKMIVNDELERMYVDAVMAYLIINEYAWSNERIMISFIRIAG
jgi:hypothetical protein